MSFLIDFGQDLLLSIPLIGAYVIFALGIVVIFRASRVLNLAHGAMAMAPAYVYFQLSTRWHVPALIALAVGIGSGATLGWLVKRVFVQPLAKVSPTAQTVGTVAAYGLILAIVAKLFGTLAFNPVRLFPDNPIHVGSATLRGGAIGLFVIALLVSGALHLLFTRTDIGLAMRAVADSPRASLLMGIDSQRVTSIAWMLGGGTAAIAGILLAAATNLQPYTLSLQALPGFVAILIGGLESLPGAVIGGSVVGALIGVVPILPGFGKATGAPQLMLMLVAFVLMALRGQRFSAVNVHAGSIRSPEEPQMRRSMLTPRKMMWRGDLIAVACALVLVFPALPGVGTSLLGDAGVALIYALVGISLVLLIGLVGQISLAQASIVGIGAFVTGRVIGHVPFPANLPIAAGAAGLVALALGLAALRIRGPYLAVATLIFAWMTDAYLFQQRWLVGIGGSTSFKVPTLGPNEGFPFFDFTERRTFYYVALATVVAVAGSIASLRRSKTGRAFFAVRGSETAAASLGIDVTRYKLLAFAMSGAIAGIAGNLFAAHSGVVVTSEFTFTTSLFFLSIAVVGGLNSIGGAIGAGVVFALLNELFFRVQALSGYLDIVSAALLIAVLLAYPAGLSGVPRTLQGIIDRIRPHAERLSFLSVKQRDWLSLMVRKRAQNLRASLSRTGKGDEGDAAAAAGQGPLQKLMGLAARDPAVAVDGGATSVESASHSNRSAESSDAQKVPAPSNDGQHSLLAHLALDAFGNRETVLPRRDAGIERANLLSLSDVGMRFGGLHAVQDVSLRVHEGEIVGLIGPNGAGKTTLFNCISGLLVPTGGTITLFGTDVSRTAVHARAARGLGRTFQIIQLFPQLTVSENLLVATHNHNPTGVLAHLGLTRRALVSERAVRTIVERIIEVFGLADVAERSVSTLPFGAMRMVELARAIVTGARLVMLDEPASGLDNAETEHFGELLLALRSSLGLTFFLIEHDVQMVTRVTDYIYVLDRGRLLAEGTPAEIGENPTVIAAYLGGEVLEAAGM